MMTELSVNEICDLLRTLPESIAIQEQICIQKSAALRQAELDFDREYSLHFQAAKMTDLRDAESKQVAISKTITWRELRNKAETDKEIEDMIMRKLQNEFVSVRKIASIRNEEMRMAGR